MRQGREQQTAVFEDRLQRVISDFGSDLRPEVRFQLMNHHFLHGELEEINLLIGFGQHFQGSAELFELLGRQLMQRRNRQLHQGQSKT